MIPPRPWAYDPENETIVDANGAVVLLNPPPYRMEEGTMRCIVKLANKCKGKCDACIAVGTQRTV